MPNLRRVCRMIRRSIPPRSIPPRSTGRSIPSRNGVPTLAAALDAPCDDAADGMPGGGGHPRGFVVIVVVVVVALR